MVKTAIVLAAGFGTRLQSVVKDVPKPMAEINGKPFLEHLIKYLESYGIKKIIIHISYLGEIIEEYFGNRYNDIEINYSKVDKPIGTGGGIRDSLKYSSDDEDILVLNGDSILEVDIKDYYQKYKEKNADTALSLKPMRNYDRYGTVITNSDNRIIKFEEKKFTEKGNINGGIYIIKKDIFKRHNIDQEVFSFEKDYFEKYFEEDKIFGFEYDEYFIDIGLPEDYNRAKEHFK